MFHQLVFVIKNKNHHSIIVAIVITSGQTCDRVKTRLDRNSSDFQRRAPVSGSRVFRDIGDFGDRKNARTNTEIHRNTPKEAASAGRSHLVHVWLSSGKHAISR